MNSQQTYDAIFIGSGIGSLACAAVLAREKKMRCLILERHFRAGGFTHAFERKGFRWDVGIHYIGNMQPDSTLRKVFHYLSGGRLTWKKMPDEFDVFEYPGLSLRVPSSRAEYERRLTGLFPDEAPAIARYFRDLEKAAGWMAFYMMSRSLPGPLAWIARILEDRRGRLALSTTADYLNGHFRSEELKALLASQWGDYGLPPKESCFFIHAVIATHYFDGGWYPVGGGSAVLDTILPAIEESGGACLVNHEVEQILVENGRAAGVRVRASHGRTVETREFRAPIIVSDAGALNTYERLCPEPPPFLSEIQKLGRGGSAVTVYLGLRESPEKLGLRGENHWIYTSFDHDSIPARTPETISGKPPMAFLSFPSMKDPEATKHTAELICFARYDEFQKFASLPWKKRGPAYDAMKAKMADGMLALVEERYPGFRALVEFQEVSTPVTVEHFTAFAHGAVYGLAATPARYRCRSLGAKTHLPGLFLTGADSACLGIGGAMMAGVFTASAVLGGASFLSIMGRIQKLKIPAEK